MRAFRLAYDGRDYRGFQRQPDVETIEGELFDALRALGALEKDASKPEGYAAAGRTDAGVSAVSQTIGFRCPDWLAPRALNAELSAAIRAWASADVRPDFHATHNATAREYTYYLHAPDAEPELMDEALDALSGTHDFHDLTPDERNTTRTLEAAVEADGPFLELRFDAGGFSRQLVRRLVALIEGVAIGELPFSRVERVLSAERVDGPAGIGPAPAYPLVLGEVTYPNVEFEIDERAAASAREVFEAKRVERETRARVAGTVADSIG
jgi:tRNA pseudouridine38-40 synthase